MSDPPKEGELAKAPDNAEDELEKERKEFASNLNTFASQNESKAKGIETQLEPINRNTYNDSNLTNANNGGSQNPEEGIGSPDEDKLYQDLLKKTVDLQNKLLVADEKNKTFTYTRFQLLLGIVGTTAGVSSLIYTIIRNTNRNQPSTNVPVPADTRDQIIDLVKQWNSQSDTDYWNDLATYVADTTKIPQLTILDQILFMNYTIDLFTSDAWIWNSQADLSDMVKQFVTIYSQNQSSTAAMYRQATVVQYQNQVMPRPVAANVLRLALTRILILLDA
jgi:hypothetical protein